MADTGMSLRATGRAQKGRVSVPPPLADLRPQGMGHAWAWLPDVPGAIWAPLDVLPDPPGAGWLDVDVRDRVAMATRFPQFRGPALQPAPAPRYGRPPKTSSEAAQSVALLSDAAGLSLNGIVSLLYGLEPGGADRGTTEADAARKRIKRARQAGRRWLCAQRALPWAVWDDGELPAEWWRHQYFVVALDHWQDAAELCPVESEPASIEECLERIERDNPQPLRPGVPLVPERRDWLAALDPE